MAKIGDILVAKRTNVNAGYYRGDTIEVVRNSPFKGDLIGRNLTRGGEAYLGDFFRGKKINKTSKQTNKPLYKISFLGIPLFTVRKAVDE